MSTQEDSRYQRFVEVSPDWLWEVSCDGIYTYSNPRVLDILGYTPQIEESEQSIFIRITYPG